MSFIKQPICNLPHADASQISDSPHLSTEDVEEFNNHPLEHGSPEDPYDVKVIISGLADVSHLDDQHFEADLVGAINTALKTNDAEEEEVHPRTDAHMDGEEHQSDILMESQEPPNATSSKHAELTEDQKALKSGDCNERSGSASQNIDDDIINWTLSKTQLSRRMIKAKKSKTSPDTPGPSK
ncbi:hypothetical protein JAAARDRAFT_193454 [Jaapia argillacea MUCL 33604]|uniref:Uncharacterized protein n=1 Tax=Jaapia argillacea MUCL 33604 TaxID=933084 RepID=A0A067PTD3_9AGAM|nr:hypothetical protein JAAARDRAFT_193454 [Jaapia argillacea MUCL 33604]